MSNLYVSTVRISDERAITPLVFCRVKAGQALLPEHHVVWSLSGRADTQRKWLYRRLTDRALRVVSSTPPSSSPYATVLTTREQSYAWLQTGMRLVFKLRANAVKRVIVDGKTRKALALQLDDVTADGLVIRETKFQKSRLLPLHATVRQGLDRYLAARREVVAADRALFISVAGQSLPYNSVRYVFLQLLDRTGLRGVHAGRDPRIHDLRHTFAVRSLEQCSHDRTAVARHIVALSTYLAHAHVTDTYWYLQATPVLMGQIAEAGEALLMGGAA